MGLDLKSLAADLLGIAQAAAPLVGLDDELKAGLALAEKVKTTIANVKSAFDADDQIALSAALDELTAKVNAHADKTAESLS